MHRDRTVARILLILHVVHLAVARPAIVRQRSLDVDEDVTAALEKRRNYDETPQDLYPVPQIGNELPTTSGILQSRNYPPPESGTAQLENDPRPASGTLPVHDDLRNAEGAPSSHESETPPHTPEAHVVPQNTWKTNFKVMGMFGAIAAVAAAAGFGGLAWYKATHKPQPDDGDNDGFVPMEPDDVYGRDVSAHPRLPKKPVSRALANLRDEDSRLLSVLTRRVLDRLDKARVSERNAEY